LEAEVNKSPQPGPLRVMLAQTAAQAGRDDLAIEQLQQAVREAPGNYVGHFLLAAVDSRKGDLDHAFATLEKARELQLQPDNPALLNAVAYYFAESGGDLDEALTMAQRAVQKLNNDPNSADALGAALQKNPSKQEEAKIKSLLAQLR
jgi:cytochrome c-type biogenesis protein CcmH/NrfG